MSNTSVQLFSLPVTFVLEDVGEGQTLLGICEGSCIYRIWDRVVHIMLTIFTIMLIRPGNEVERIST